MSNKSARFLLVFSSMRFMRSRAPETELHQWADRIEQRSGKRKARIALARKLAVVMIAMWKSGQPYSPRLASMPDEQLRQTLA